MSFFHRFTFPTIHFHLHLSVTANIETYCKREACWDLVQKKKYEISDECREKLITASDLEAEAIIAKKEQKVTTSLQNELDIFNKQAPFWESMIKRGKEQDVLNPYDVQLLQVAVNYCNLVYTELSPKQVKGIVSIVAKLKENGIE